MTALGLSAKSAEPGSRLLRVETLLAKVGANLESADQELRDLVGQDSTIQAQLALDCIESAFGHFNHARVLLANHRGETAQPTLEQVMAEATAWAAETFPHATASSCAAHLLREATELALNPTDPEEMADVVLLVGHLAAAAGVDLAQAAAAKLAKNRARRWGQPDADGVVEHIRSDQ